mgnify:CR=1 FL=1
MHSFFQPVFFFLFLLLLHFSKNEARTKKNGGASIRTFHINFTIFRCMWPFNWVGVSSYPYDLLIGTFDFDVLRLYGSNESKRRILAFTTRSFLLNIEFIHLYKSPSNLNRFFTENMSLKLNLFLLKLRHNNPIM